MKLWQFLFTSPTGKVVAADQIISSRVAAKDRMAACIVMSPHCPGLVLDPNGVGMGGKGNGVILQYMGEDGSRERQGLISYQTKAGEQVFA